MAFDEVFAYVGECSRYQFLIFCCLGIYSLILGLQNFSSPYATIDQDHWCHVDSLSNLTFERQRHLAIPWNNNTNDYDRCHVFDYPWDKLTEADLTDMDRNSTQHSTIVPCKAWAHNRDISPETIITKWDLVCGYNWMTGFADSLYLLGNMMGSFIAGPTGDRYGRRTSLLIFAVLYIPVSIGAAFAPFYSLYAVLRWLVALTSVGAYYSGFVLLTEIIGPKHRTNAGILYQLFFVVGYAASPGIASVTRHYQYFYLALCTPGIIGLILVISIVPESPRWLFTVNKLKDAIKILRKMAMYNNSTIDVEKLKLDETKSALEDQNKDKASKEKNIPISSLFTHPLLRIYYLIGFYQWTAISVIFWAIGLSIGVLVGDIYLNGCLMGLTEMPVLFLCLLLMEKLGRKWALGMPFVICGLTTTGTIFLELYDEGNPAITALAIIGRGAIATAYNAIVLYTAEIFPTKIRQFSLGSTNMVCKIATLGAPYMGIYLKSIWTPLPSLLFGSMSILGIGTFFFLPETLNMPLPDTLEDIENRAKATKLRKSRKKTSSLNDTKYDQIPINAEQA